MLLKINAKFFIFAINIIQQTNTNMIYIGIYNRHKLILQCLEHYFAANSEINVALAVSTKDALFEKMANRTVNILIINVLEITHNDLDTIISVKMKYPKTSVLIMSDSGRDDMVLKAIKAGAKGFLTVDSDISDLIQAIYTIRGGHDFYSDSITRILLSRYADNIKGNTSAADDYNDESTALSSRQIEILKHWGEGMSNQEIADKLFISVRTVETHKNHIMQKLNLKSSVDLIKFAIRNNIIQI